MKFFWWVLLAVAAVLLILFAVSNRESVAVGLWPLPDAVELPLYLVILGTLVVGFFLGELVAWVGGWRRWREARRARERIAMLEHELDAERARPAAAAAPPPLAAIPR